MKSSKCLFQINFERQIGTPEPHLSFNPPFRGVNLWHLLVHIIVSVKIIYTIFTLPHISTPSIPRRPIINHPRFHLVPLLTANGDIRKPWIINVWCFYHHSLYPPPVFHQTCVVPPRAWVVSMTDLDVLSWVPVHETVPHSQSPHGKMDFMLHCSPFYEYWSPTSLLEIQATILRLSLKLSSYNIWHHDFCLHLFPYWGWVAACMLQINTPIINIVKITATSNESKTQHPCYWRACFLRNVVSK